MAESTGFLSLSRELRQKILDYTFDDLTDQYMGFCNNVNLLVDIVRRDKRIRYFNDNFPKHVSGPYLYAWPSTLALVHDKIREDLPFVLNKHISVLENRNYEVIRFFERPTYVLYGSSN